MRTPLRLSATLLKSRFAQTFRGAKKYSPLCRIVVPAPSEKTSASAVKAPASPILWLTGAPDTLSSPDIGKFTRHLQETGRTIFLETDGTQLRRRIHEFRPSERLFLTIRLYGTPPTHDRRVQRDGAFDSAMEGIRTAQLSGFLLCAHVVVEHHTQLHEINLLLQQLGNMNLDGIIITAEDEDSQALQEMAVAARSLIGDSWWTSFSRLVQRSISAPPASVAAIAPSAPRSGGTSQPPPASPAAADSQNTAVPSEVAVP
jgi:hypothetical protein